MCISTAGIRYTAIIIMMIHFGIRTGISVFLMPGILSGIAHVLTAPDFISLQAMIHFIGDIILPGDGVIGTRLTEIMAITTADIGRITLDIISLHKQSL